VIAGTPMFFSSCKVFEAASANAPAVVFIDDSDVIFEGRTGALSLLLTTAGPVWRARRRRRVFVLTAMDVGGLPPALVRSGRIELCSRRVCPSTPHRQPSLRDRARRPVRREWGRRRPPSRRDELRTRDRAGWRACGDARQTRLEPELDAAERRAPRAAAHVHRGEPRDITPADALALHTVPAV